MKRYILTFAIFILFGTIVTFADDNQQVVTLKDGSQIVGQLVGINNGVYTIKAPIIGNVQANADDVVSITNRVPGYSGNPTTGYPVNPSSPGNPYPGNPGQGNPQPIGPEPQPGNPSWPNQPPDLDQRIMNEQRALMSNPESMALLMQMAQDPEVVQLLQDPSLVEEVTHHDLHAVENNPKIKELMNNPHVQEFLRRLEAIQDHDHDHDHGYSTNSAS